jgi:hypothetical protein
MRITNILPCSLYLSYAGTGPGGRTLKSGETSPILPFKVLLVDQMWKDLRTDKIRVRLDQGDKDFIEDLKRIDVQIIVVKQLPPPPPKPKKNKPPASQAPASVQPKKSTSKKTYEPMTLITAEQIKSGKVSIKDLQMQNRVVPTVSKATGVPTTDLKQKATLDEIQTHMKGRV